MGVLYRALDLNNNVVYGEEYKKWKGKIYLFGDLVTEVQPESISRFTGFSDVNGNRIFEHDVLLINNEQWKVQLYQRFGDSLILTSSPMDIQTMFVVTNVNTKETMLLKDRPLLDEIHYGTIKSVKVR